MLPTTVNGRIDSAVKLVLAGDVELLPEGGARVASRSDAQMTYLTVNGRCECKDFAGAPEGLCAHRLAYGIARRAVALAPPVPEPESGGSTDTSPLPEAPASVNCHITIAGRQAQLTLRDSDETSLLARLAKVLAQYPVPAQSQGPSQPQGQGKEWCSTHQVAMKLHHGNDGKTWYSHKTADGQWCKGKGGAR